MLQFSKSFSGYLNCHLYFLKRADLIIITGHTCGVIKNLDEISNLYLMRDIVRIIRLQEFLQLRK